MKIKWLETTLKQQVRDSEPVSYASLVEESLKIATMAIHQEGTLVVVKENVYLASKLSEILLPLFEEGEVVSFLPEESLRSEAIAASYENRAERIYALYRILKQQPKIVILTPYGLVRHLPDPDYLKQFLIHLKVDETMSRESLIDLFAKAGYERVSRVEHPLSYAVRGYIVDVFMINYSRPLRIEFFDDVIDSLRFFDLNTQNTVDSVKEVELCFAKDISFDEDEKKTLHQILTHPSGAVEMDLDYIDHDLYNPKLYFYSSYFSRSHILDYINRVTLYLSEENRLIEHMDFLIEDSHAFIVEEVENGELPDGQQQLFADYLKTIEAYPKRSGQAFSDSVPLVEEVDLPYAPLKDLLKIVNAKEGRYTILAVEGKEAEEVIETLIDLKIPYAIIDEELSEGLNLYPVALSEGFAIKTADLNVYTAAELFAKRTPKGRFAMKYEEASVLSSYEELKVGDYVVHNQYGIGQYRGIEQREVNHIRLDYLKIAYAGDDVLLVPLSQFSLVRKYVSKEGVTPRLHKIGSKQWQKTKDKVKEDVDDLARRLVELYSLRETKSGHAFSPDNALQKEFEADFLYELTPDQDRAVREVKADMEQEKPMDRLLCGDVGFGKTEVALRAAFKAVSDQKQVAYLCPTTILSLQHYKTFLSRLMNYPVQVALLNRFATPAEQREILDRLKEGKVDIVIGTHRLLSKDVKFKDLGLLIIDEEQRFGVEHKEKIKELKNSIDVLSLSATPIPRTLQMSLIGIYGLSVLDTPPQNRYPIQTYVVEKNRGLIREVISRELDRGGQVFYLYNDINQIYHVAKQIEESVPYAKVAVAHGQMSKDELEEVMLKFYQGEANVLICTTIIETGIDIPNANTILVEHAENFGLSQLYQIKGRVGRSDKVAYAYLLIPPKKELSEKSRKRLDAIKEFTALGSGYKIAMRDLAIRGAGDLLGDMQSGFIDNVGLDLYLSMLQQAIEKERDGLEEKEEKTPLNVPISSYIPENFSSNDYDKLTVYHRLDAIESREELAEYEKTLSDQYGHLPKEVAALFDKKRIELLIRNREIESAKVVQGRFILTLSPTSSDRIDGYKLFDYCNKLSKDIKISYAQKKLTLMTENRKENVYKLISLSENLKELEKKDAH